MAAIRGVGGGRKPDNKNQAVILPATDCLKEVPTPTGLRDKNATEIWNTQSKVLIEREVLTLADLPLLLAYCNSFSMYLQAEKEIKKFGFSAESEQGGLKKHPSVGARQDALSMMVRSGSLLGLDPLSRTKLLGSTNSAEEENVFNRF